MIWISTISLIVSTLTLIWVILEVISERSSIKEIEKRFVLQEREKDLFPVRTIEIPSFTEDPRCATCLGPVTEDSMTVQMEIPLLDGRNLPVTIYVCDRCQIG